MELTPSQLDVLETFRSNRVTVVRAGPGSGKTRVFVEALKTALEGCNRPGQGVAALSFTNTAHEEVTERLGGAPGETHFIGTLDSFFFRYVLRPFGSAVEFPREGARLVPAPQANALHEPQVKTGGGRADFACLYSLRISGGTEDAPDMWVKKKKLNGTFGKQALASFNKDYRQTGRVSHAGVNYLAAKILDGAHGAKVSRLLAVRFPVLLVDEFQDTGYFAGRALHRLVQNSGIRCLIVGDPDQAIFKFGGASGQLFADMEGIKGTCARSLVESHRCPERIARVAANLSRTNKGVTPARIDPAGEARLIIYDQNRPNPEALVQAVGWSCRETTVLVRNNTTLRTMLGNPTRSPKGNSVAVKIDRAVSLLLRGDSLGAAKQLAAVLGKVILDKPVLGREELDGFAITELDWKLAVRRVLFEAARVPSPDESWNLWLGRVRTRIAEEAVRLDHPVVKPGIKVRAVDKAFADQARAVPAESHAFGSLGTVHSAKGREYPLVLFVVPKPHKTQHPCPSDEWWNPDDTSEEMETAFVACSRAQERLAIAVHRQTYDALVAKRKGFVDLFDVVESQ